MKNVVSEKITKQTNITVINKKTYIDNVHKLLTTLNHQRSKRWRQKESKAQ